MLVAAVVVTVAGSKVVVVVRVFVCEKVTTSVSVDVVAVTVLVTGTLMVDVTV